MQHGYIIRKRAQAIAELAIYGALLLLVLGAALSYMRSIREQQLLDQQVFRQALSDAYNHEFQVETINEEMITDYGSTVSYSKTLDKQSGVLFEPNRRGYASSYTVFWSGAEDPPDISKTEVNKDDLSDSIPGKKITYYRSNEAFETPDKEMELTTWDVIAVIAPSLATAALSNKVIIDYIGISAGWASAIGFAIRAAQYAYLYAQYENVVDEQEEIEQRRETLKGQDEQFQKWGWRIATDDKDGDDGIEAGKYYVKEIDAQTYYTGSDSATDYTSTEDKDEDNTNIVNRRYISLTDTVNREFKMRYDVTSPDPTLAPSEHEYEYAADELDLADIVLSQGLGVDREYSSSDVGSNVIEEQTWATRQ